VRTDFKMLEVEVPIIFSGMLGFPLRMDGRYSSLDITASERSTSQLHCDHLTRLIFLGTLFVSNFSSFYCLS
jgi:hypothetical protein